MCNVDDNGRDVIQPSLFKTYCDMVNIQQLSMHNKMSQTLSKSSSSNNYNSIYGGLRGIQAMKLGVWLKETQTLEHQGPKFSNKDSKSNECRNTFYQMSGFSR